MADKMSQTIVLQTTPGDQIPMHLAANARCRSCNRFNPYTEFPPDVEVGSTQFCDCAEPEMPPMLWPSEDTVGKTVAICGAGPSLKECYKHIRKADHVWGCNRAANYLHDWGWKLTHAFGIDAGTGMWESAWPDPPPVSESYLLATSVHPYLVDHVLNAGHKVTLFHSIRGGVQDEQKLYRLIYPPTLIAGNGLNSVNRALGVAVQLGYRKVWICGADNALKGDAFYADGSNKGDHEKGAVYLEGKVHGRTWKTTPDMLMSATDLARLKWHCGDKVELVGNTLPRALSRTSDAFLDKCIRWATEDEQAAVVADDEPESNECTVANTEPVHVDS